MKLLMAEDFFPTGQNSHAASDSSKRCSNPTRDRRVGAVAALSVATNVAGDIRGAGRTYEDAVANGQSAATELRKPARVQGFDEPDAGTHSRTPSACRSPVGGRIRFRL